MKIGIDVRCLMNSRYSGVSWYTHYLLKNIFELDSDNQYLLFFNSSKKVSLPRFDYSNVRYVGFHWPNKIFNLLLNFFNYPKIDRLLGGVDVFITPNLHFIALSDKCKKIMVVHDLSFIRYPQFFTRKMRIWHWLILRKKLVDKADFIVADSQNTKKDLEELLKINKDKIKVVYPGVDEAMGQNTDEAQLEKIKSRYRLPEKFILYLGTLEPRKNLGGIINAYQKLTADCDLVIGGGQGWGRSYQDIKRLAEKDPHVHYLGYIEEADKPYLYRLAKLFVYPSYYEGFGLPILEAFAYGCPVVCGSNSAQVEVANGVAILVNPYDSNEIKRAVEEILTDDLLRQKLIERGRERVKQFAWQKTAQDISDIINKQEIL